MTMVEAWIRTPVAAALGRTLLHSLWEGSSIALLLALAFCFLQSSKARYAAGCLAMLGMFVIFGGTFARSLSPRPAVMAGPATGLPRLAEAPPGSSQGDWGFQKKSDFAPWLVPFWIAGVLAFHIRCVTTWMGSRRMRRVGVCLASDAWRERFERLRERARVSQPVALLESCLAEVPVVIGHFRPVVLMPVGLLAGLPAGQVEAILLHELAHIRRYDYLVNVLQSVVESLLFYHPAVWWISNSIRTERENCCDDLVVAVRGGAYEYARALAALEQKRMPREALAATGGSLVKRIRRILAQPEPRSFVLTPVVTAVLVAATAMVAMAWQSKPAATPSLPSAGRAAVPASAISPASRRPVPLVAQVKQSPNRFGVTPQQEPGSPYGKWLKEDVAYIIADEERQAFKRLETDQERERFIEQFWLRRDPTPGTTENEMQEEHYRRLAYANERFGAYVPGWKTDRGRVYIVYGPPDEIDSHPAGGRYARPAEQGGGTTTTFPFERWRYKFIEDLGTNIIVEFVDPERTGEYRMTMDPSEKDALLVMAAPPLPGTRGKTHATVQVMGNSAALISLPLASYGDHRVRISGRIITSGKSQADTFEDTIQGPAPLYTRFIAVRGGSYQLRLTVKDETTGTVAADDLEFEVK